MGKSAAALSLSRKIRGELVNADSRQIYRHLNIGTSKPAETEIQEAPHHLYDFLDPHRAYNAAEYARDASCTIEAVFSRGNIPILVGGTGLYIRALFEGFSPMPPADTALREKLLKEAEQHGRKYLHNKLAELDPQSAARIPHQNIQRVVRALEVCTLTGKPMSHSHDVKSEPVTRRKRKIFGLMWPRAELKARLIERTRRIIPGILAETEWLLAHGYSPADPGLQSLGYKDAAEFLSGAISREKFEQSVLTDTLQYSKRQMTWFRKMPDVRWIPCAEPFDANRVADEIARDMI